MALKNLEIKTQLLLGLSVILLLVITLGVISYRQSDKIHEQTELMYQHPLMVRRALGNFKSDLLVIQRDSRDLLLSVSKEEIDRNLFEILEAHSDAQIQLDVINNLYLGPKKDIDSLKIEFVKWEFMRDEAIKLYKAGKTNEFASQIRSSGNIGRQAGILLGKLVKIENFAEIKSNEFYYQSGELNRVLNIRLFWIIICTMFLMAMIFIIMIRNIRQPLTELHRATRAFQDGDLDARSNYTSKNEFGPLSDSFNELAEKLQGSIELSKKTETVERMMLQEEDADKFFHSVLQKLCELTGSQMAAVYLLNHNKKTYTHFTSIGIAAKARQSFSALDYEGEFGAATSSFSIQHIKNVNEDTRFVFSTVTGDLLPNEILTVPLQSGTEIFAVISLATINTYSASTLRFLNEMLISMSTRAEGVLAIREIREISSKLEAQNKELELQKTELITQSAMLTEQNTELELQKKQLAEASRLKTNFLSNMSHELRTPLNSVIALTGVLNRRLKDRIPDEEYSYLEVIERNGKNLLALINDILDISRIESGREEIEITSFNLREQITNITTMIQPQARQKKINIEINPGGEDVMITGDEGKIYHILQNIISNAVKFTEKGTVNITIARSNINVNVTIADSGIGIAEEHLPHIFDEFRQADSSTSRRFGGTGLGLALARKYAELLGGNITVKSTLNVGSEFTLTLPLEFVPEISIKKPIQAASYTVMLDKPVPRPEISDRDITILLVEDSEPAIIQIQELLLEKGLKILVARDGEEALAIIGNMTPTAVILDLMMPGIDGFQVLKSIRSSEKTAGIPVLILTSKYISKEELSFLKQNNIHQLIQKGQVNPEDLINEVLSMVIPKKAEAEKVIPKRPAAEARPKVLIVEDNPDNMLAVKAILAGNYQVIEAVNGKDGVKAAKEFIPDIILMDIEMPEMNGIDAFKIIRNTPELANVPIIALTASALAKDQEAILAYGFNTYIAKPIEEKIFFNTINKTLYGE